jgi:murein DD-endopeptidase MepM/ murein hydrolase activator NlpD
VGEILAEGAVVGTIGDSGRLDGVPQLHFEVIRGEEALDPEEWLAK